MGEGRGLSALLPFLLVYSLGFFSCRKENIIQSDPLHQSVIAGLTVSEDVLVSSVALFSGSLPAQIGSTGVLDLDTLSDGSISLNFGDSLKGADGRFRSGKLIFTFFSDTSFGVTLDSFSVVSFSTINLSGTLQVRKKEMLNPYFDISMDLQTNSSVKDFSPVNVRLMQQREWLSGGTTVLQTDDVISCKTQGSVSYTGGDVWQISSLTPSIRPANIGCRDFVSGQMAISLPNRNALLYDWGAGSCDRFYSVTQSGRTTVYRIP